MEAISTTNNTNDQSIPFPHDQHGFRFTFWQGRPTSFAGFLKRKRRSSISDSGPGKGIPTAIPIYHIIRHGQTDGQSCR